MSLDIHQLTAHLPRERRIEVLRAYRQQAKHDTTAFLFCFFLGTIGAHRLYLRQWSAALPRLVLGGLFLAGLVVGVLMQAPLGVLAVALAALFIVMLAWEIADLYTIDTEVDQVNRALAERLLGARPASAAPASPAPQGAAAPAGMGMITAADIAGALALAEEVGAGRVRESTAMPGGSQTSPARAASATPSAHPAGDLTDAHPWSGTTHPIADPDADGGGSVYVALPTAPGAGSPSAAPTVMTSAGPDHTDAHTPQAHPIADVEALAGAAGAAAVYVNLPREASPMPPPMSGAPDHTDHHAQIQRTHPIADVEGAAGGAVVVNLPAGAPALAVTPGPDLTDAHPQAPQAQPVGDIEAGAGHGGVYVNLPSGQAPASDDALVMFVPREEAPVPPAEYLPPTMSPPAAPPTGGAPIWPVAPQAESGAPPVWPVTPPTEAGADGERHPETLAELAALGGAAGVAGAAALAAEHGTPATPSAPAGTAAEPTMPLPGGAAPATPPAEPAPAVPMKRIRVVRRIVLEDGGVVRELVAERIVPMDADSQAIAAELEAELAHATPEEIAQLAHLPSDTPIVVRSRVESGPLSGKLTPTDEQTPPAQSGH